MASTKSTLSVEFNGQLNLNEREMRALYTLTKWDRNKLYEHICKFLPEREFDKVGFLGVLTAVANEVGLCLNQVDQIRRDVQDAEMRRYKAKQEREEAHKDA